MISLRNQTKKRIQLNDTQRNWMAALLRLSSDQVQAPMDDICGHETQANAAYEAIVARMAKGHPARVEAQLRGTCEKVKKEQTMSQEKTLRQRIQAGEVLVALRGSVNTSKNQLADIWATGRYDYIWIDSQHTAFSEAQFVAYCTAAEALGIDVQLRIPHTRHAYMVGRYLDLGCSAVLVPEVMDVETVDDAIGYAYYPQIGRRSWGGAARRGLRGVAQGMDRRAYAAWWNDYVILSIQVESVEAVTNIRKLAKPGVIVVTFGPNDLSFNLEGHKGFPLASVDDCMRYVAAQLQGTGIRLAMGTGTKPEERDKYLEMGVTLFQEDAPA